MNKSIWLSAVIAIQSLSFVGLLILGSHYQNVTWMRLENWMFVLLMAFVTLSFFYMDIEWGFGASGKRSENEEVAAAFSKADLNKDGVISREEATQAGLAGIFESFDTDKVRLFNSRTISQRVYVRATQLQSLRKD